MVEVFEDERRRMRGDDGHCQAEECRRQPAQAVKMLTGRAREDVGADKQPEPNWRAAAGPSKIAKRGQHLVAVFLAEVWRVQGQERRIEALGSHDADGRTPRFRAARTSSLSRRASSSTTVRPFFVSL